MNSWQQILNLNPGKRDHFPAGRIALGGALPLSLLLWQGRPDLAIFAAFAAFSGIYARHEPAGARFRHQATAALMLLVCEALGLYLAYSQANQWVVIGAGALVASTGAVLVHVWHLRPAGSLFLVFSVTAIAGMRHPPPYAEALATAGGTALFCVLLGLVGAAFSRRIRPNELTLPYIEPLTPSGLFWYGLRYFVAAWVAGALGLYSAFGHSYWAMVAALAPISALNYQARVQRAIHHIVGTMGGIGLTVFLLAFTPNLWLTGLLVVVMQFFAEMFMNRNYSLALFFITPMALLLTQLGAHSNPWMLVTSRAVETVIGALVGLTVVALLRSPEERLKEGGASPPPLTDRK